MESLHKNIKLMLESFKAPFLDLHFFLIYVNYVPEDVIAVYFGDTTHYSKCQQASDLWQQLEMASELHWGNVEWDTKSLVDFNARKTQLILFDWPNNTDAIDVKMDGYIFEKKSTF